MASNPIPNAAPSVAVRRAAVVSATSRLAGLSKFVTGVGNDELGVFFGEIDDLVRQADAARVALLAEALGRGVVAQSDCASAAGWVIEQGPSFQSGGAAQLGHGRPRHQGGAQRRVGWRGVRWAGAGP